MHKFTLNLIKHFISIHLIFSDVNEYQANVIEFFQLDYQSCMKMKLNELIRTVIRTSRKKLDTL